MWRPRPGTRHLDPRYALDLLLAADPDRSRLRTGLRAVLIAGVSALVLSRAAAWVHQPASVWLPGLALGMSSAIMVNDPVLGAQRVTSALLPLAGMLGAALATIGGTSRPLGVIIALALMYGAVLVRRFGVRGVGLGMGAFLTFFIAVYLRVTARQLPALAGALAITAVISYAIRFWVVRDAPDRNVGRVIRSYRHDVAVVVRRLADLCMARSLSAAVDARLEASGDRLRETALAADEVVDRLPPDGLGSELPADEVRARLFDLQLAAERSVLAVRQLVASGALPASLRNEVRRALFAARVVLLRGDAGARSAGAAALDRAHRALGDAGPSAAAADLRRLRSSIRDLLDTSLRVDPVERAASTRRVALVAPRPAAGTGPASNATRQAVQATMAGGLAMAAGYAISPTRWYWAVIASFVVFTRAATVGDTLLRAWLRILGTILGAVAGILLAHAVAAHPDAQIAIAFACIFLAYYLVRWSYAAFVFWFTALLAVLYELLGLYSYRVLVLRLEETAAGAFLGSLIAAVVLPVATGSRIRELAAQLLEAFAGYMGTAVCDRARAAADVPVVDAARALDARLRDLRAAAEPFLGTFTRLAPVTSALVHSLTSVVVFARHLAPGQAFTGIDDPARAAITQAAARMVENARVVCAALTGGSPGAVTPAAERIERARSSPAVRHAERRGPHSAPVWLDWLERVDEALLDVARSAGCEIAERVDGVGVRGEDAVR